MSVCCRKGCGRPVDRSHESVIMYGSKILCSDCHMEWSSIRHRAWKQFLDPPPLPKDDPKGMNLARKIERGLVDPPKNYTYH